MDLADWETDALLRIAGILLGAVILNWAARRAIGRGLLKIAQHDARLPAAQRVQTLTTVARSAASVALWTIAAFLVLAELEVSLGPLLAGAGVIGVALGFGAQSLVRDLLAGFFILAEDQFRVGDVVDLGEVRGKVEAINLRTTQLRADEGTVWYVPNGEIKRVGNVSRRDPAGPAADRAVDDASAPAGERTEG